VQVLVEIVEDRRDRLERRLRKCLALAHVGRQTQFDSLQGARLSKYLQAVRNAVELEVPREPANLQEPDRVLGGMAFRALLAIYARRDRDRGRASGIWNRLGRVRDGWRFVRGRGRVPRVNEFLPETRFPELEQRIGTPPEIDETLERFYLVKLNSLQFCGPTNFALPFWDGLDALLLTLPMILWLTRAFTDQPPEKAAQQSVQLVDDHFGNNPMLGLPHIQALMRILAQRGELEKLIAWYSR
jgi:lysine-N-methylase